MTPAELELVAREHQAEIYRYLRYLGADSLLAEELVQETLLAAFNGSAKGELAEWTPGRRAAWLRGVARNLWLIHLRRKSRRKETPDTDLVVRKVEESEQVWTGIFLRDNDGFDYLEALRGCMESLNARQRDVIQGFYADGKSREALAGDVGMTVDGIKTLLRRVRAALAECVQSKINAEGGAHVISVR